MKDQQWMENKWDELNDYSNLREFLDGIIGSRMQWIPRVEMDESREYSVARVCRTE